MKDLNFQLKQMCEQNRNGSYSTQHTRHLILQDVANQLDAAGFKRMDATSLKPKHVDWLVEKWKGEDLTHGTIKNRLSAIRWWSGKINKQNVVRRTNEEYGVEKRCYITNVSKSRELDYQKLAKVSDENIKLSLQLQSAFGLRREEAIKFTPSFADKGDHIELKSTWTKGGKSRTVPITTEAQRQLLDTLHEKVGGASLIPSERNYVEQLRIYERQTLVNGLHKNHGLRHHYAQDRYFVMTERLAPAAGGKKSNELTKEEKAQDGIVRLAISKELGHEREQVTAIYLGR